MKQLFTLPLSFSLPCVRSCYIILVILCVFAGKTDLFAQESDSIPQTPDKLGETYFEVASRYQKLREHDSAVYYYRRALLAFEESGQLLRWSKSHRKIYGVFNAQKQYDSIAYNLDQAFLQLEATNDLKVLSEIGVLRFFNGFAHYRIGNYSTAIRNYEKSLEIFQELKLDTTHLPFFLRPITVGKNILYPKVLSMLALGEYQGVINSLPDDFLEGWGNELTNETEGDILAKLYNAKGNAFLRQGDTTSAYQYYEKATKITRLSPIRKLRVAIQSGVGFYFLKDYAEAEKRLLVSLKNVQAPNMKPNDRHLMESEIYLYLGYIARDRRDFFNGHRYADSAFSIGKQVWKNQYHENLSDVYRLKGWLFSLEKKFPEGRAQYAEALKSFVSTSPDSIQGGALNFKILSPRPEVRWIYRLLADNWWKEYKETKKSELLVKALEAYKTMVLTEDVMKSHHMFDYSRLYVGEKRSQYLQSAIEAAYELWEETQDESALEYAWFFMEKSKAQELQLALEQKGIIDSLKLPETLTSGLQEAWSRLHEARSYLDSLTLLSNPDEKLLVSWQGKANQLAYDYYNLKNHLEDSLRKKNSGYLTWVQAPHVVSLSEVREQLAEEAALVSFLESGGYLYSMSIHTDKILFDRTPFGNAELAELAFFEDFFNNPNADETARLRYQRLGYEWFEKLLGAVKDWEVEELILVPDPVLQSISMSALLTDRSPLDEFVPYRVLPYVWRKYVSYCTHSATLWHDAIQSSFGKKQYAYAGFAPDYSGYLNVLDENTRSSISLLLYNQEEIGNVLQQLSRWKMRYKKLTNETAKESTFLELAPITNVLHVSLHAHKADSVRKAHLLFSYTGDADHRNDGTLFIEEIYPLTLNPELLVLSACQTGLGDPIEGEGVMSLGRAFAYTGCPNVLMSLWNVRDYSSNILIPLYFKYLQAGMGKSEALQAAREEYMNNELAPDAAMHPFFWAPYVMYGDNEEVNFGGWRWEYAVGSVVFLIIGFFMWRYLRKRKASPS